LLLGYINNIKEHKMQWFLTYLLSQNSKTLILD
jgi:hypothetical protein